MHAKTHQVAAIALAAVVAMAGCSSKPEMTHGAPPLRVCGTTLWSGAEGAVIEDATGPSRTVRYVSSGDAIYLRLAPNCAHGVRLSVPAGAARVVTVARAEDGATVAAAIQPERNSFDLHITRIDGQDTTIAVRLRHAG